MQHRTKILVVALAGIALVLVGAFFLWLFSLEGSKGLGQWGWNGIYLAIAALGVLPLVLALLSLAFRAEASKPASAFGGASIGFTVLAAAGILILFGTIYTKAHRVAGPVPALNLVNPASGIRPAAAGPDGGILRLALSSDAHWGADNSAASERTAILRSVAAMKGGPDAFFILGDQTQQGWNDSEWRSEATEVSAILGRMPFRPILGNHDAIIDGEYHFRRYFFPPALSSDTGSPFYYSIDAGPARIIVLDLLWGPEDFNAARRAWLEKTLAAVPADKRIIVLSHAFFASSGYIDEGTKQPWYDHAGNLAVVAPILEKHKVDLVVQGHNHYMEFLRKDGVSYATIGAMGGFPDPVPSHVSPWSLWFQRGTYGWLDIAATKKGIGLTSRDEGPRPLARAQYFGFRGETLPSVARTSITSSRRPRS
jgi:UDP-2,3-diacylglucosamine pyrophosphatase LpxH